MARRKTSGSVPKIPTVTFRPKSSDGRLDYEIPKDVAQRLFDEGIIWGDATNGGYMPNPESRYNVAQHKVWPAHANPTTSR